ncbi:MAG: bifunctional glutamate N-acetyltransferase/amino-acid acetyltransferase ArgJ [Hyphomicrobiaceae bacterium]
MSDPHVSPFAPEKIISPESVEGVRFATAQAGIRYKDRTDLMLAMFSTGTVAAGVVTQSKTRSAPVEWCVEQLKHGAACGLVVNSGNANAFTGKRGVEATTITAQAAAKACGCNPENIFLSSTGVIGEAMDATKFVHLLVDMACAAQPGNMTDAAHAIMTTDTYAKVAQRSVPFRGYTCRLAGIAKGAGMIAPDMATMLSYIFTDVPIAQPVLQALVDEHVKTTFNCISVDGDTSTSDTLLVFATGKAGDHGVLPITELADPRAAIFSKFLAEVMQDLALAIVKDGEGLTKFVTLNISGAENAAAAKTIGLAIANSPLVKTALAAEDPNWGRIVMAVGKSGEAANRDQLRIMIGPHLVAENGEVAENYAEDAAATYMKNAEIEINVDVGVGEGQATIWTCDLTHDYVSINADYRT